MDTPNTDGSALDLSQPEVQFRCGFRLQGIRIGNVLEILCRNCRQGESGVVAHYFNLETGELIASKRYDSVENLRKLKKLARKQNSAKSAAD